MTQLATLLCVCGIFGLFLLDREPKTRSSRTLYIPAFWIAIAGSRMVSDWLAVLSGGGSSQTNINNDASVYLDGSPLDRNVFVALLLLGLLILTARRQRVTELLRKNGPILLFFGYCGVSVLWSDYAEVAFKRWVKDLGDLVMVMVILTEPDALQAVSRLLKWTAFLLIPLSILFCKYYPDIGRAYRPWTWDPYYTGVTNNKNSLGMLCMLLGLGSLWRFLVALRGGRATRKPLIAHGTILTMVLWLLWKANSATSWSCFLMGGL